MGNLADSTVLNTEEAGNIHPSYNENVMNNDPFKRDFVTLNK